MVYTEYEVIARHTQHNGVEQGNNSIVFNPIMLAGHNVQACQRIVAEVVTLVIAV